MHKDMTAAKEEREATDNKLLAARSSRPIQKQQESVEIGMEIIG